MKKELLLILILAISNASFSQNFKLLAEMRFYQTQFGQGATEFQDIAIDKEQNIYVLGIVDQGQIAFISPSQYVYPVIDTKNDSVKRIKTLGSSNKPEHFIFLAKYYPDGRYAWGVQVIPDSTYNLIFGIKQAQLLIDNNSNCYILGLGNRETLLWKYSSEGVLLWSKLISDEIENEHSFFNDISNRKFTMDSLGNVYIMGTFEKSCKIDNFILNPQANTEFMYDGFLFLLKIDANGHVIFAKSIANAGLRLKDISIDSENNILIGGTFFEFTYTLNTKELYKGNGIYIVKTDLNGKTIWAKNILMEPPINDTYLNFDKSGGFYLFVDYSVKINSKTGEIRDGSSTEYAPIIARYNEKGIIEWQKKTDEKYNLGVREIFKSDKMDNLYMDIRTSVSKVEIVYPKGRMLNVEPYIYKYPYSLNKYSSSGKSKTIMLNLAPDKINTFSYEFSIKELNFDYTNKYYYFIGEILNDGSAMGFYLGKMEIN